MKLQKIHFVVALLVYIAVIPWFLNLDILSPKVTKISIPIESVWIAPGMQAFKHSPQKIKSMDLSSNLVTTKIRSQYCPTDKDCKTFCKSYDYKPLPRNAIPPRIFWGVIFNNEIDILELLLHEMSEYLHSIVIVEANVTFSGKPRNMNFPRYAERLSNFSHKIIYAPWSQRTPNEKFYNAMQDVNPEFYGREEAIRNSISRHWSSAGLRATDIAVVADADEFLNREFLAAAHVCDLFPLTSAAHTTENSGDIIDTKRTDKVVGAQLTAKHLSAQHSLVSAASISSNTDSSTAALLERCNKRTKVMAKVNVFSSYVDCPQIAQYGNQTSVYPGIKIYWHPDLCPGECVLNSAATNFSVENLRTLGGSNRLTKRRVGWHYRNQNMRPDEILYKYLNYGHPDGSPLFTMFNLTSDLLNVTHAMKETEKDCSVRTKLITGSHMKVSDLPVLLQNEETRTKYKYLFYDYDDFYRMLL